MMRCGIGAVVIMGASLAGCGRGEKATVPPRPTIPPPAVVVKQVSAQNALATKADAKAKSVDLTLSVADGELTVRLTNTGSQPISVIRPALDYTVGFRYFDAKGKEIKPRTKVAVSLPAMDGGETLGAGQGLDGTVKKQDLLSRYSGLKDCAFVVAVYHPSEFALDGAKFDRKQVLLQKGELWSNAVAW